MSTPSSSASTIVKTAVSAANPNVRTWTQLNDGNDGNHRNSLFQPQPLEWNVSPNTSVLVRSRAEPVIHTPSPFDRNINKAA